KVNDAVHDTVIRDGHAVHAKFLYSCNTLFDFIGTVQEAVLRMDVEMYKTHISRPLSLFCVFFFHYIKKKISGKEKLPSLRQIFYCSHLFFLRPGSSSSSYILPVYQYPPAHKLQPPAPGSLRRRRYSP